MKIRIKRISATTTMLTMMLISMRMTMMMQEFFRDISGGARQDVTMVLNQYGHVGADSERHR